MHLAIGGGRGRARGDAEGKSMRNRQWKGASHPSSTMSRSLSIGRPKTAISLCHFRDRGKKGKILNQPRRKSRQKSNNTIVIIRNIISIFIFPFRSGRSAALHKRMQTAKTSKRWADVSGCLRALEHNRAPRSAPSPPSARNNDVVYFIGFRSFLSHVKNALRTCQIYIWILLPLLSCSYLRLPLCPRYQTILSNE